MISINEVLQYIKRNLGYPKVSLELNDEEIVDIIKHESLMAFEKLVPDKGRRIIRKGSKKFRVKKNLYWVIDPLDREVFWVQDVIPEESELLANGYPYTTPLIGFENIPDYVQRANQAHTMLRWGKTLHWWQEPGINQVWIFSEEGVSGQYSVSYTRSHAPDLSTINREYAMSFMNIALANTKMVMGNIRNKYGSIGTPLGEIPINGNELYSQGETLLNSTLEDLDKIKPIFCDMVVAFG